MLRSRWIALLLLLLGVRLPSQEPRASTVTLRGVAYDSLRGHPLVDAFVTLDGVRSTTTDARGRFHFDSVAPGSRTLAAQHAALDSAGLSGIAVRVAATGGVGEVVLATPSFATLWRDVCGAAVPAADTGFVFGAVTDAVSARPLAGAAIRVMWTRLDERAVRTGDFDHLEVAPKQWVGAARSGPAGTFGVCGVPSGTAVRVLATTDSAASGVIDLPPDGRRVRRLDLRLAVAPDTAAIPRGTVTGVVTDTAGRPLPNVRLALAGAADVRSADDGRFVLRDVPAGTRQVEAFAIGMSPATTVVDVTPGGTVPVALQLRRVTTLEVVNVVASPARRRIIQAFEERRRMGIGYFRDSTAIGDAGTLSAVFTLFPSIEVVRGRGSASSRFTLLARTGGIRPCAAFVYIDGRLDTVEQIDFLRPGDIAAVEVYPHAAQVPAEFTNARGSCGVVSLWTKDAFAYRFGGTSP